MTVVVEQAELHSRVIVVAGYICSEGITAEGGDVCDHLWLFGDALNDAVYIVGLDLLDGLRDLDEVGALGCDCDCKQNDDNSHQLIISI